MPPRTLSHVLTANLSQMLLCPSLPPPLQCAAGMEGEVLEGEGEAGAGAGFVAKAAAFTRSLSGLDRLPLYAKLLNYLSTCEQPFEQSLLYSSATDTKFVDESLRSSSFRAIVDPALFAITEELLALISTADEAYEFTIRRNDATHIRYTKGGFFKRHQDYLSLTSNVLEEWTMLLCVTPPDLAASTRGGETIIHSYKSSQSFPSTMTPGGGLIFRKDLAHEGARVLEGEKHILSLNLLVKRKVAGGDAQDQVLLIDFAQQDKVDGAGILGAFGRGESMEGTVDSDTVDSGGGGTDQVDSGGGESKSDSGGGSSSLAISKTSHREMGAALVAANNARTYAINTNDLEVGSMLATAVEWANREASENDEPRSPIVTYTCRDFSYEEFDTVFRILTRQRVGEEAILTHTAAIDFFGPFKADHILVELAVDEANRGAKDEPGPIGSAAGSKKPRLTKDDDDGAGGGGKKEEPRVIEYDTDVIVCESVERQQVLLHLAKTFSLPYVPFQVVYIEGTFAVVWEGDPQIEDVPMMPVAIALGYVLNYCSVCISNLTPWSLTTPKLVPQPTRWLHSIAECVRSNTHVHSLDSPLFNLFPGSDYNNLFSTTPYAHRGTPSHTCMPDVSNVFDSIENSNELENELADMRQAVDKMKSEHPEMCGESALSLPLPFPEYEAAFTAYRRTHGWNALGFEVDEAKRDANEVISANNRHAGMNHSRHRHAVSLLVELEASAETLRGLKPGDQVTGGAMKLVQDHGNDRDDYEVNTTGYGLRMAVAGDSRDLLHSLSGFLDVHMPSDKAINMVYCPGVSLDEAQDSMQGADAVGSGGDGGDGGDGCGAAGGYDDADSATLDLFHRNAEDKICFTPAEASRASKHIAELNLDEVRLGDAVRLYV